MKGAGRQGKLGEGLRRGCFELVELFSAPRVVRTANANGLRGGWALDLNHCDPVTGSEWDLSEPAAQAKVWKMLRRDKPLVVGMSPECTLFSLLQNLRKTEIPKAEYDRAVACVKLCAEVFHFQRNAGRFFLYRASVDRYILEFRLLGRIEEYNGC